jgi:hypothetical protein
MKKKQIKCRVPIFSQYEKLVTFLYYHLTHNISQVSEIVENQRKDKSLFQGVGFVPAHSVPAGQ